MTGLQEQGNPEESFGGGIFHTHFLKTPITGLPENAEPHAVFYKMNPGSGIVTGLEVASYGETKHGKDGQPELKPFVKPKIFPVNQEVRAAIKKELEEWLASRQN